jgi:hypothetical protein
MALMIVQPFGKESTVLKSLDIAMCLPLFHFILLYWNDAYQDFCFNLYDKYYFSNLTLANY